MVFTVCGKNDTVKFSTFAFALLPAVVLSGCGSDSENGNAAPDTEPLSGVIRIEANSRIDQDTMEQLARAGSQPATGVQVLPANFVLAGYVSGDSGFFTAIQDDTFDYRTDRRDDYIVPMAPGESIALQSFGSRAGNPELRLSFPELTSVVRSTDRDRAPATLSWNGSNTELVNVRVTVTASGPGAARYILSKVAGELAEQKDFFWPNHRFIPGQAVVSTAADEEPVPQGILMTASAPQAERLGPNRWLMTMPRSRAASAASADATLRWIESLRSVPGIVSATPNYQMTAFQSMPLAPTAEELYPRQWHYDLINGPVAWQLAPDGGEGVTVAVLDSGLFRDSGASVWHPDLDANIVPGQDFVDNDSLPQDPGSQIGTSVFHGTHVAGIIAATLGNSSGSDPDYGMAGVAFNAGILPVRVLGEGGTGSSLDLINAIRWVTGERPAGPPRADIVNMSLGGLPEIPDLEAAIQFGVDRGLLFVGAAGNSSTSAPSFPAASPNVLAVSAVDAAGKLASYSNFGSWIDLAAPGGDASRDGDNDGRADVVWSTSAVLNGGLFQPDHIGLQGTSMAAPHVAGVLALMKARNGLLDTSGLRALLVAGELTDSQGLNGNTHGYGILDASKALQAGESGVATVLSPSPSFVALSNESETRKTVRLARIGPGGITPPVVTRSPGWLTIAAPQPQGNDFLLSISLNPSAIEPDVAYRSDVVISYQGGNQQRTLSIPVSAQVFSDEQARDAGEHFVLLVETEPNSEGFYNAVSQVSATADQGQYVFRFRAEDGEEPWALDEVVPGDYFLVAGSDTDGDGLICQPGEACAEYPVTGLREVISIREGDPLNSLWLTTSYSRSSITAETPDVLPRPGFKGYRLMNSGPESAQRAGAKAIQ